MKDIDRNINAQIYEKNVFIEQNKNVMMSSIGLDLNNYNLIKVHEFVYNVNTSYERRLVDSYTFNKGIYLIKHRFTVDVDAVGYSYITLRMSTSIEYGNYGYIAASPKTDENSFADNFIIAGFDKEQKIDFIATTMTDPILIKSNVIYYQLVEK